MDRTKGSAALPMAFYVTVAYCVLVFAIFIWRGTTVSELRDLGPNEIGDLLAGVFAPLAFLWLVAAVFIQRRELELTRIEFEMNRQVTKEQANAAERQAAFVKEQTDLLTAEKEERLTALTDRLFDERMTTLDEHLRNLDIGYRVEPPNPTYDNGYRSIAAGGDIPALIQGLADFQTDLLRGEVKSGPHHEELRLFGERLQDVISLLPNVSSVASERASRRQIEVCGASVAESLAMINRWQKNEAIGG